MIVLFEKIMLLHPYFFLSPLQPYPITHYHTLIFSLLFNPTHHHTPSYLSSLHQPSSPSFSLSFLNPSPCITTQHRPINTQSPLITVLLFLINSHDPHLLSLSHRKSPPHLLLLTTLIFSLSLKIATNNQHNPQNPTLILYLSRSGCMGVVSRFSVSKFGCRFWRVGVLRFWCDYVIKNIMIFMQLESNINMHRNKIHLQYSSINEMESATSDFHVMHYIFIF